MKSDEKTGMNRRDFMRAALGVGVGTAVPAVLTSVGVVKYLKGPSLTSKEKEELLSRRLKQAQLTRDEQLLMLERIREDYIAVAKLEELDEYKGKYFTDYELRPAMAFLDADGLPNLISAKCTHLGCTVRNEVDDNNNVLCPCHISYFNVETGEPNKGAPAKVALPKIGWVLKDSKGNIIMSKSPAGKVEGAPPTDEQFEEATVYIAKRFAEGKA
jgi:Rieske Fe-S protein